MPARRFAWTPELRELAAQLIREGHVIEIVAERVGASRNCIFTAIRKNGWKRGESAARKPKGLGQWVKTPRNSEVAKQRDAEMRRLMENFAYAFPKEVKGAGTEIYKLGAVGGECRWPLGIIDGVSQQFCGAAVNSGAYCTVHHALAYRPATRNDNAAEHELRRVAIRGEPGVKVTQE